jgi:hypothetical protein
MLNPQIKMKYAVIIKHPFRDSDYRVDVVDVDANVSPIDIRKIIEAEMLGPFEVIAVTPKYSSDRDISKGLERITKDTERHIET